MANLPKQPLCVFDLPEELLNTLVLKEHADQQPRKHEVSQSTLPVSVTVSEPSTEQNESQADAPSAATSCALCSLNFPNYEEQRAHIRSDLHGYNLKQKLRGLRPVGEAEFEKLVGDLDESISGSDSSGSESDEEDQTKPKDSTLSALLKKQAKIANPEGDHVFATKKRKRGPGNAPLLWLKSTFLPEKTNLGIYRALFSPEELEERTHMVDTIRRMQLRPTPAAPKPAPNDEGGVPRPKDSATSQGPHYFLCMIGGGHFAAMIVALTPKPNKTQAGGSERKPRVLAHKTFHRYTTRRKQGGSQAANDSAKGAAHSAGSSLRRYNETALVNEVRELLGSWKGFIDTAQRLFVRATGSTNRRTLFGPYDGQILRHDDSRIRAIPFSTRRATQSELMRAYEELTSVKVSQVDESALKAQEEADVPRKDAPPSRPQASPKPSKPSPEEEEALLHTSQLTALIKRSRVPALLSYFSSNSISPTFQFHPPSQHHHAPTPLHLAASLNGTPLVSALLIKARVDPVVRNSEGKTPFELAGERATRDAFRAARGELGEEAWDWSAASVPSALSKSDLESRERQEKQAKEEENAKEKERRKAEVERLKLAEADKNSAKGKAKGRTIGAIEKTAAERREEEARGMTPEVRARLERERRARAAEERIRRMQGGG